MTPDALQANLQLMGNFILLSKSHEGRKRPSRLGHDPCNQYVCQRGYPFYCISYKETYQDVRKYSCPNYRSRPYSWGWLVSHQGGAHPKNVGQNRRRAARRRSHAGFGCANLFCFLKGIASVYFPGAGPAPELTIAGSPEQIARDEYLASVGCLVCHGSYANDFESFPEDPEFPLAGGLNFGEVEEEFPPIGQIVATNLTPGGKLAGYTDGEIFRAIRHGVSQDGHKLTMMSLLPYKQMSDDDIMAIIAFLPTFRTKDRVNNNNGLRVQKSLVFSVEWAINLGFGGEQPPYQTE